VLSLLDFDCKFAVLKPTQPFLLALEWFLPSKDVFKLKLVDRSFAKVFINCQP